MVWTRGLQALWPNIPAKFHFCPSEVPRKKFCMLIATLQLSSSQMVCLGDTGCIASSLLLKSQYDRIENLLSLKKKYSFFKTFILFSYVCYQLFFFLSSCHAWKRFKVPHSRMHWKRTRQQQSQHTQKVVQNTCCLLKIWRELMCILMVVLWDWMLFTLLQNAYEQQD